MEMNQITVSDADLRKGAEEGMDAFLKVFIDKYLEVTGGKINADTMPLLNGYQHTLLGYHFFREEVMEGGFVRSSCGSCGNESHQVQVRPWSGPQSQGPD